MFVLYCHGVTSGNSHKAIYISLYFCQEIITYFFVDRILSMSLLRWSRKLFLILANSISLIISHISFSKTWRFSFCGGVATDLNPKFLQLLLSFSVFSLQIWYAFHLKLLTNLSTFSTIPCKYFDFNGICKFF